MQLLKKLQDFDISTVKSGMSAKAKKGLSALKKSMGNLDGPELVSALRGKSTAAAGLYKWASATDKYFDIFKMVEPKKKLAEDMQKAQIKA